MSVVKGSKQRPVRVVHYTPWYARFFVYSIFLLVAAGVAAGCYFYGHKTGVNQQEKALKDVVELREALMLSKARVQELEQSFANANLGAEIDKQANEDVRQEVINLKETVAKLEEENSFYRGIMAPNKDKKGLTIGAVELTPGDAPRSYGYKVMLQQLATNHAVLTGTLSFKVEGRRNGEAVVLNLKELSKDVSAETVRLRFKYFQNVEGTLTLPEGFEPEGISIEARSKGKKATTVKKRFGWLVEEV